MEHHEIHAGVKGRNKSQNNRLFAAKKNAHWLAANLIVVCMASSCAYGGQVAWKHLSTVTGDIPTPAASSGQSAALVLDIDKDGINDFVIASWYSSEPLVWYRRQTNGWTKYIIDTETTHLEAGEAFYDIDNDGDLDIVFGDAAPDNCVYWWENPYPNFSPAMPWTRHIIRNSGDGGYHDMIFGDFDGDGQTELVSWNAGIFLLMFEIPASPRTSGTWPVQTIYSSGGVKREGLAAVDINLDGKQEIIGGGQWFEYIGGGNFTPHIIDDNMGITRCAAGRLISDSSYPQVVFCPGDADGPAKWYQWNGGSWQSHIFISNVIHGHSLALADIDGDSNLDIFVGEMAQWNWAVDNQNAKVRVLYGDGQGNFTEQIVMTGQGVHESKVADLDGDGKIDILGKPFLHNIPRLDVWLNNSLTGDLNRDGKVNLSDFNFLASHWQTAGSDESCWCKRADINHSGRVDLSDFGHIAAYWFLNGCGAPDWCMGADTNQDGRVNQNDIGIFAAQWLRNDCRETVWFTDADLDNNGRVDGHDLELFVQHWLECIEQGCN